MFLGTKKATNQFWNLITIRTDTELEELLNTIRFNDLKLWYLDPATGHIYAAKVESPRRSRHSDAFSKICPISIWLNDVDEKQIIAHIPYRRE